MPETDTKDKVITLLEHRLEEQKSQHREEMERTLHHHERMRHEITELHKEKIKELLAQNDGMLGVVGRLQTENDALKQKVLSVQADRERIELQAKIREGQLLEKAERIKEEATRFAAEKKAEIDRLKRKKKK